MQVLDIRMQGDFDELHVRNAVCCSKLPAWVLAGASYEECCRRDSR